MPAPKYPWTTWIMDGETHVVDLSEYDVSVQVFRVTLSAVARRRNVRYKTVELGDQKIKLQFKPYNDDHSWFDG